MNDILRKPRTGEEVSRAAGGVPVYLYSDVCRLMKEKGAVPAICHILKPYGKCFILIQHPNNMRSGHWNALEINPKKQEIYYFSSYGGKPDEEKNRWIDLDGRLKSEQEVNPLNDALKQFCQYGWKIFYNDFPYQREGDKTATCGIWAAAFLNSNRDPDEFAHFNNENGITVYDYFNWYFK